MPPAPDSVELGPRQTPEPTGVPDRISIDGVPALVAREQFADPVAVVALSGNEPQLVELRPVRGERDSGDIDVQVPLEDDSPAEPVPPPAAVSVQAPELPRAGLDVIPLAALGLAMLIAGIAVLRVSSLRAPSDE